MAKKQPQKQGKAGKGKDSGGGKKDKAAVAPDKIPIRLQEIYNQSVRSGMMEKFKYSNVMEIPRLEKVIVNMGVGEAIANPKTLENAVRELEQITGQKPVVTKARKSISNFKLRQGVKIGTKVTGIDAG